VDDDTRTAKSHLSEADPNISRRIPEQYAKANTYNRVEHIRLYRHAGENDFIWAQTKVLDDHLFFDDAVEETVSNDPMVRQPMNPQHESSNADYSK
jgi:hypothetical protein